MQTALTQAVIDRAKLAKRPYEIRDSRLNGFLVRVQPSGVKSFYCEYDRGKRWRLGRADSMAVGQARNQAKRIISQYHSGIDPMDEKNQTPEQSRSVSLSIYFPTLGSISSKGT
ncbi:Arm DNA-binding domain-containing protein [Sphingopyxis sp. BSNA05]|uniref:Arm DNA-binding domain-containing protein n=1 Tax=Sphingopyxis sp. BSNA05 TaxID=1236614 RepID=UPI00156719B9